MRVTHVLLRQHLGRYFQNHWAVQARKKVLNTRADKILSERGIPILDPNEFIKEVVVREPVKVVGWGNRKAKNLNLDDWHERPLLTYKDHNVLLEGLDQAKILTNTVQIQKGLPEQYVLQDIKREVNRKVKKLIFEAHIFDAQQEKLPKIKDPERPAYNFPRVYGVTQNRRFMLLIKKLLNLIESTTDLNIVKQRYVAENLLFSYPFEHNEDLVQFQLLGDIVLLTNKPLGPVTDDKGDNINLPDLFPVKATVTLESTQNYNVENIYPVNKNMPKNIPHTLFINFDRENVKNLFEEEVTDDQIYSRILLKTFSAASSYARTQYGKNVKQLPKPVTLQAIQTDGRMFYFGVLQLNTLDPHSSDIKNIWYQSDGLPLFTKCAYEAGKPELAGYDRKVINHVVAFYNKV